MKDDDRERRLEGAFTLAFQTLAYISRGVGKGRSNVHGRLTAGVAKAAATRGVELSLRALAGQDVRPADGERKVGLAPTGKDAASDVLRAVGWLTTEPTEEAK